MSCFKNNVCLALKIMKAHHLKCFSAETAMKKGPFKLVQVEETQNIFFLKLGIF